MLKKEHEVFFFHVKTHQLRVTLPRLSAILRYTKVQRNELLQINQLHAGDWCITYMLKSFAFTVNNGIALKVLESMQKR